MNNTDLTSANIYNLTKFWESLDYTNQKTSSSGQIKKTRHWPDRLWYDFGYTPNEEDLSTLSLLLEEDDTGIKFPVWDNGFELISLLEQFGFEKMYQQTAMVLPMKKAPLVNSCILDLQTITTNKEAEVWTAIASKSFGYPIDDAIIKAAINTPSLKFIQAYNQDNSPVGTVLLVDEPELTGIHMMGVSPDYRRQNIAREIMHYIINNSLKSDKKYLTLQASPMGRPLYKSLGFIEQFCYPTYFRK